VRLKEDGSLDLDWREQERPTLPPEDEELFNLILLRHPGISSEEAEEMLYFFSF